MKRGDKKGFTIIEVSLVLAIAGLIFLMIFIALPALRRTQRDSARRDDLLSFVKLVKDYQTNNRGALPGSAETNPGIVSWTNANNSTNDPTTWKGFYRDYLGDKFVDPNGENYKLQIVACGTSTVDADCTTNDLKVLPTKAFPNDYKVFVVRQATCYGDKARKVANPRKIAVLYRMEGAGVFCTNT